MKPKYIIIIVLYGIWALLVSATIAKAQPPAPQPSTKSGSLAPLTQITETPVGSTGWCGEDFVLFNFSRNASAISSGVVWFSNDADLFRTSRAISYLWYDQWYNLIAASTTPIVAKAEAPKTFLEAPHPVGFWTTYVYRGGYTLKVGNVYAPVVVTMFLRSKAQTCVIHKVISGVGEKG